MKADDIAAVALLLGGAKVLSDRSKRLDKEGKKADPYAMGRAGTKEELSAARRKAAREELNPEGRIGGPRSPMVSSSGDPVTTGTGGFAFTEDIPDSAVSGANFRRAMGLKKGGAVKAKSASSRADGIAQRGKTKGRIV